MSASFLHRVVYINTTEGSGKTTLARLIATEAKANMLELSLQDIIRGEVSDSYTIISITLNDDDDDDDCRQVGESERRLRVAFADAERKKPCVLMLDEMQAMFGHRDSASNVHRTVRISLYFVSSPDCTLASDAAARGA